jgi:bifunctional non-homologous end joining protein LigD
MSLEKYREKRHFDVTPEPSPQKARRGARALLYVVQKHQASHLHYDFRLQWNDVLLSWAVPKGPSPDPAVKRLAMAVEDHPLEYASFEGVIPQGEYGAGTVMVWDRGTWQPEVEDVDEALRHGDLKFQLHGQKLKGSWVLVRTQGKFARGRSSWLLIKHRDQFASSVDVTVEQPRSAVSGLLLAQIAEKSGGDVSQAAKGDPPAQVPARGKGATRAGATPSGRRAKSARARAKAAGS